MNSSLLESIEKNLANGITSHEDFLYIQSIWDTLSPGAQAEIFELSVTASQYVNTAVTQATIGDVDFPGNWKEHTLWLVKKQIQHIEQEDCNNESRISLFSGL